MLAEGINKPTIAFFFCFSVTFQSLKVNNSHKLTIDNGSPNCCVMPIMNLIFVLVVHLSSVILKTCFINKIRNTNWKYPLVSSLSSVFMCEVPRLLPSDK